MLEASFSSPGVGRGGRPQPRRGTGWTVPEDMWLPKSSVAEDKAEATKLACVALGLAHLQRTSSRRAQGAPASWGSRDPPQDFEKSGARDPPLHPLL